MIVLLKANRLTRGDYRSVKMVACLRAYIDRSHLFHVAGYVLTYVTLDIRVYQVLEENRPLQIAGICLFALKSQLI